MSAKRALREFRASDETAAQERAWTIVHHALPAPVNRRRRPRWRATLALAVCLLLGLLALSPAGASVRHWISHALGEPHAAPALFSLPSPGRVLVSGSGWDMDRQRRRVRAAPWLLAAGELVAARPVRGGRTGRRARGGRPARDATLDPVKTKRPRSQLVSTNRLSRRLPVRRAAARRRRRRDRRSPARQ